MNPNGQNTGPESSGQWKSLYRLGGICAFAALAGNVLDIAIGSALEGTVAEGGAVERYAQFLSNPLIGLYNLDFLNLCIQLISVPAFYALYSAHRNIKAAYAGLSLFIFLIGTAVFTANNAALPMLDLSLKYASVSTDEQKAIIAAAGEAVLAKGAHGSPGVLLSFVLPSLSSVIMSFVMLKGRIFGKTNAVLGILGFSLLLFYLLAVTFMPGTKPYAMAFALPGGLLAMAWTVLYALKLFNLSKSEVKGEII